MAGILRKKSTITSSILYFLTISVISLNIVRSQNQQANAQFEEQVDAAFEKFQINDRDQFENEFQVQREDQVRNEYQTRYEPQLLSLPNESSKQYKQDVHLESLNSYTDDDQNLAEILNITQLLKDDQLPNNEQLMIKFILSLKNIFSQLIDNNFPIEFRDVMKRLRTVSYEDIENEMKNFTLFLMLNISSECFTSLQDLQTGLKEKKLWALRMVDSFGKIPNGILDGTRISFGDFDMCLDSELPGKYQGRYCMVKIKRLSKKSKREPLQPLDLSFVFNRNFSKHLVDYEFHDALVDFQLTTSVCLPSNCSKREVQSILTKVNSYVDQLVDIKVRQCHIREEFQLNQVQKYILTVLLILLLFEVFATILDFRLRYVYREQFDELKLSKSTQCMLAFSFYSNTIRIFSTTEASDSFDIIHGLRAISQMWIIFTHTILIHLLTLGRFYQAFLHWTEFFFQIIQNGFLATDSFVFIGGFLVMYSYMKSNTSQITFVYYALVRFIRLMPPVLFFIGCLFLMENLSSGPMWKLIMNFLIRPCKINWWRNFLLINNVDKLEDCCLFWTWYVSTDMQLYFIVYPILILIKKKPKIAVLIMKIIVIANVVGLFIIYAIYRLPPHPILVYSHLLDYTYFVEMGHFKPYNHVAPYFLGMLTGYIIATNKRISLTRNRQFLGCFFATIFASICLFTTYIWNHSARPATVIESALYGSTHRLLWSLVLMWIIYTCMNEKPGIIVSILSWKRFVTLSRLTYMAFLMHPLILAFFFAKLKFSVLADFKFMVLTFLGFLSVSYILAFPASLICEAPFIRLKSIIFSSDMKKTKAN